MKEERAEIEAKKNKNEEELEKDEEKDEENNKNILAAANISRARVGRDEEEARKVFSRYAAGKGKVAKSVGEIGEVDE